VREREEGRSIEEEREKGEEGRKGKKR